MVSIIITEPVPSEAELLQIMQQANARHLHLITDGKQSRLCSIIPPGWRLHRVSFKPAQQVAA